MESESIQSIASSSLTPRYDVFVSFRGEDLRYSFADHLFAAFQRKGIVAFRDDTNIKQGEHISTELRQAIEGSQVLIPVFSKNYATSSWCLEELKQIVDCMKREVPTRQHVLPVFYDVSPSEVRKQSGDYYEKAFANHEERFKQDLGMVQGWREALKEVADLCGSDIQNKSQSREIEKIVKRVMSILGNKFSCLPNDLVGMQSHIDELEKFLVLDSHNDVQVVGIWGMSGIGKTTLARVLYHRFSHQYDASCFIDDVSKIYQHHGPLGVHKQLHHQVLNEDNREVSNLSEATYLTRTLLSKAKVFIVFDNVDEPEQLEGLATNYDELLCAGSKIIVVSRNKHILQQFGVNKDYQVQQLNGDDAFKLFCRKAFKCGYIMREYELLIDQALEYAQGHPLAIKVLASSLLGRDISELRSTLDSLRDNPKRQIIDVLRVSFDGLEHAEKEIFLDIACFFNGKNEIEVKRILKCCGFHPEIGIRVLIDHSLITVNRYGSILMHGMLVELGKKIVREKAPNDPRKWSRIWRLKDFQNIMFDKTTMEDLEAIQIDEEGRNQEETLLRADVLSAMTRLRLLIIKVPNLTGRLDCLSNKLQYLEWHRYPFTYLPSSFEPNELVEVILPFSKIRRLWKDIKPLHNLRIMDLRGSENLTKTPNFRGLTNLEELNLGGCTKLVEIHPSIGLLTKLRVLNLQFCINLKSIPYSIFDLSSLEELNLSHCSKVFNNQPLWDGRHAEDLKRLDVSETAMTCKSTSSSILKKFSSQLFSSTKKNNIVSLLLPSFQCLQELNLYFCNLKSIPDVIGRLHCLEKLNLGGNDFVTLPTTMKDLPRLRSLYLTYCNQLKYLPELALSTHLLAETERKFVDNENLLPGLYIFNCPKMIGVEIWSNIALSWMKQLLKIHHRSWPRFNWFHCVVPGSQVPMWFENQSAGNKIILDPVLMHDSDCIGLALCAAFVAPADIHSTIESDSTGPLPMQLCWRYGIIITALKIPVLMEKDLIKVELDHLLLVYTPLEFFIRYGSGEYDLNKFQVSLDFSRSPIRPVKSLVVKKWSFRWVFKQDLELEQVIPTMSNLSLEPKTRPTTQP